MVLQMFSHNSTSINTKGDCSI